VLKDRGPPSARICARRFCCFVRVVDVVVVESSLLLEASLFAATEAADNFVLNRVGVDDDDDDDDGLLMVGRIVVNLADADGR